MRVAILDDYQNVALKMADWAPVRARADITIFNDTLADAERLVARLTPFEIICVMRERTPLPGHVLRRLPKLKLIASTARRNASIDVKAAEELGITITHTGYTSSPTVELTWALILASARKIVEEANALRTGGWQRHLGSDLSGKTLGVLGLGNIGREIAKIGVAFGMRPVAWSPNLTEERAAEAGVTLVSKSELFAQADVLSIHLVLGRSTRGVVDGTALASMKRTATIINTSRGPLIDERALIEALKVGLIAGAAIDVFEAEPLPADHPFRSLDGVLATPHIGYVSEALYRIFYSDTVASITQWLDVQALATKP